VFAAEQLIGLLNARLLQLLGHRMRAAPPSDGEERRVFDVERPWVGPPPLSPGAVEPLKR
jgi:hypothetical protein